MRNEIQPDGRGTIATIAGVLLIAAGLALIFLALALQGCAHQETYIIDPVTGEKIITGGMDSYGVFKNIAETRKYDPATGKLIEVTTQSTSTTAEIMLGANELLGTMVEGASKVSP